MNQFDFHICYPYPDVMELVKKEPEMQRNIGLMRQCELLLIVQIAAGCDLYLSLGCGPLGFDMQLVRQRFGMMNIVGFDRVVPKADYEALQVEYHRVDLFADSTREMIRQLIQSHGKTLVYCDNGHKLQELQMFSGLLKPYDVLGVHDYTTVEVPEGSADFLLSRGYVLHEEVESWVKAHLCHQRFWIRKLVP